MQETNLPSPDIGAIGMQLRRAAVRLLSQLEIAAQYYPNGKHPGAAKVVAFFRACAAALDPINPEGGGNSGTPANALTLNGDVLTLGGEPLLLGA